MWWRRNRKKAEVEPEADSYSELGELSALTFDEQMIAAENVMACRDAANYFTSIIHEHRKDGHECLPYCMPTELHEAIEALDMPELKAVFTIVLKDVYDAYYRAQMPGGHL